MLRYSINVTLDGCCDHNVFPSGAAGQAHLEEMHVHHAATMERADALLFGRVVYEMMEEAWRRPASGEWPEWMDERAIGFAETIDAKPKHVVSTTLGAVDWNAELVRGDLAPAVRALKDQHDEVMTGGLTLPLALAELGLIDSYELVVMPVVAGHGPRLFDGLAQQLDLTLVDRKELSSGAVALTYHPAATAD
ncbi:dihydrofolate reductase family protein [Iamia majanohamensis]|uniref:Dihydrofolate reductase family protein n=2 Tax=Iamia majanohamensis TaxID=467976 RepID=A0AAE9YA84_9ACTN|nr:dihydrofolate reductase family protein [Iamia majanohamensis]WCO67259.1 dihydrofolate reductase family protein [Iamia majanohamensis]